jgi:hypothetical protein
MVYDDGPRWKCIQGGWYVSRLLPGRLEDVPPMIHIPAGWNIDSSECSPPLAHLNFQSNSRNLLPSLEFVAMPLGTGYTVEGQVTGKEVRLEVPQS